MPEAKDGASPGLRPFNHQPLHDAGKQILLLRFSKEASQETIALELEIFDIASAPPYAAISYTWGAPDGTLPISLNNHRFEVWPNCHYFLGQISHHLQSNLYFWLDSICINQTDLDEKALQVAMMGDIYIKAEGILSCVGAHADESEFVLPLVKEMATWIRSQPPEIRYKMGPATDHLSDIQAREGRQYPDFGARSTAAYIAFGNREYWQRMWIVQEARLARKCLILCGSDSIDLADFATLLRAFMNDRAADVDFCLATWLLTDMWRVIAGSTHLPKQDESDSGVKPLALSRALMTFDGHRASNFRDHLYALARLVEWPDGGAQPVPDYRSTKVQLLRYVLERLVKVDWAEHKCCAAIECLTSAFDITIHDPEIQALPQSPSPRAETFSYAGRYLRRPGGYQLRRTADGNLTANIQNNAKDRKLFAEEKARIYHSEIGVPLKVDGVVAGYLCPGAKEGDVLLEIDHGNGVPIWLVIRKADEKGDDRFEIIGPALDNPGFSFPGSARTGYTDLHDHSAIPEELQAGASVFDLWFGVEDFLIWRAWFHTFEKLRRGEEGREVVDEFLGNGWLGRGGSRAVLRERGGDWVGE